MLHFNAMHVRRHTRFITSALTLASLFLALSGCGSSIPTDSQISGKWEIESESSPGTLTLNADKTFLAETVDGHLSGTWKIDADRLVGEVAESTIPQLAKGYSWSNIIADWSKNRLVLQSRAGEADHYKRVK